MSELAFMAPARNYKRRGADNVNYSMRISKELDNLIFEASLIMSQAEGELVSKQDVMRRLLEQVMDKKTATELAESLKRPQV